MAKHDLYLYTTIFYFVDAVVYLIRFIVINIDVYTITTMVDVCCTCDRLEITVVDVQCVDD